MSQDARHGEVIDVLCITAQGGTLGVAAADVVAVREAEELPSLDVGVPSLELAPLLGPGAPGAPVRRIRVAPPGGRAIDLVTDGALLVRSVPGSALHAVPTWLRPLVAPLGAEQVLIEEGALVLVADTARLAEMGASAGAVAGEAEHE